MSITMTVDSDEGGWQEGSSMDLAGYVSLLLCAFTAAFSLPAGRGFLAVSFLLIIVGAIWTRRRPRISRTTILGFVFLSFLCIATFKGINPELGVKKLDKLIWFIGIPVTAILVSSYQRLVGLLGAFVSGGAVLAIKTYYNSIMLCVLTGQAPVPGSDEAPNHFFGKTFSQALKDGGSMTDSERLMLAIIACIGLIYICRKDKRRILWWAIALVMQVLIKL